MTEGNLVNGFEGHLVRDSATGHLRRQRRMVPVSLTNYVERNGLFTGGNHIEDPSGAADDRDAVYAGALDAIPAGWTSCPSTIKAKSVWAVQYFIASGGFVGGVEIKYKVYYARANVYYRTATVVRPDDNFGAAIGVRFTVTGFSKSSPNPAYYVSATKMVPENQDRPTTKAWAIGTSNVEITGDGVFELMAPAPTWVPYPWGGGYWEASWGVFETGWSLALCCYIEDLQIPYAQGSNEFTVSNVQVVFQPL